MDLVCKPFPRLTLRELHDLLQLRARVFVVEQRSIYLDVDGRDPESVHLLGRRGEELVACARWYREPEWVRLGRIVVDRRHRGRGLGRRILEEALEIIGDVPVGLHAQVAAEGFYAGFGFRPRGEPFDDGGIPHRLMVRP